MAEIWRLIHAVISQTPRILIDTVTGHLLNKDQRALVCESFFTTELKSMIESGRGDDIRNRVREEAKKFYQYAMLSHTWEGKEPSFQMVHGKSIYNLDSSPKNDKLQRFCLLVREKGFRWAWMDTCCIDQRNQVVLQESLVAMFVWYRGSSLTIVFLKGVRSSSNPGALITSHWNTRAWTLQEYVAATTIQFYTEDWKPYLNLTLDNHKESPEIISEMQQAVVVSHASLLALKVGSRESVREKLYLASRRNATRAEDVAYSLFGIFDIALPVIYGEGGEKAIGRLLENILTRSEDVTILAWTGQSGRYNSCLPASLRAYQTPQAEHIPAKFQGCEQIERQRGDWFSLTRLFTGTSQRSMRLYNQLEGLSPPTSVDGRLTLSALSFPLNNIHTRDPSTDRTYHGNAAALGDVKIKTREDLSQMGDLFLIHPWIHTVLAEELREFPHDKQRRAFRVLSRLAQPFGALLLTGQRGYQNFERVAADSMIMVQVRREALTKLEIGIFVIT